ncbi:ATP-binding protein, partial [Mediterraneibacter faecis]|uniref:ATP-binding protein n=1 Tax=Mediterraneibacter faecis TaxID=592978 RepID=UPI00210E30B9
HRVFQPFYRGNQEYVKKQEGSGVGLYLARKILEEQKGTISVKVAPEGGNNFVVTLPMK